jgi:hypothetical protein
MNEEYLRKIYDSKGGQSVFGSFEKYSELMVNDDTYRSKVYNSLGGEGTFGNYDQFQTVLKKKKEPTQPESGNGSNQTQPSSGSQPSQGKSYLEQASEIISGPKMSGTPQTPEQVAQSVAYAKSQQEKEKPKEKPKPAGPLNAPKASEPGQKVFSSERQLLDYMEELKANTSAESQAELKRIADDYTGIVSDINTNGSWSYESKAAEPGVTLTGKVAQQAKPTFQTAKYQLDQINAGKLDPKTVDPNGRWEERNEYDAGSTYFDAAKGGTVTTQPGMKTKKVWIPSGEFAKKVDKESGEFLENKAAEMKAQTNIVDRSFNQKNWDTYRAVSQVDVTTPERELADLEEQKKNGQVDEQYYATKKQELENRKKYSYKNLEATYLSVLEKTDPDKHKEYTERYSEVMNALNKKGFETWEDANNFLIQNGKQNIIFEGDGSLEDLIGIDQADTEFLRKLRAEAVGSSYAPIDRTIENASDRQVRQYMTDIQPVINDVKQFSSDVETLRNAFNSGAITQEEYKSRAEQLKLKEQELTARAQQVQKETGVTDFDLNRYSKEAEVQENLAINNSNFAPIYAFEKEKEKNIENRQRWVAENPVLGGLAYGTKDIWKSFTDMVILETAKSIKPISEVLEVGDGYGWADRVYYGAETAQNNRDYLYGYSGMDIDGDGKADDLPEFAKLTQTLGQGIGSVAAFAIPGTAAGKLFSGTSKLATVGRFGVNTTGAFLMMEGQAYQEALRAGLSQDDAAEAATLIASLQAVAEQAVPDIKYFDNVATRAGLIASYRNGIRGNALLRQGLAKIGELGANMSKGGFQEYGEEAFGALSTDLGKDISNELYTRVTTFNMDGTRPATYKTNPYQDLYQAKNITDNGVAGFITGGGMRFFGGLRPMSQTQMQNLSYMGKNANDILRIIEQTQSNGVNPGDATFKEIEKQLTGISETWNALQSMPGFTELTTANQDAVMALTYRKNQIQENAGKIGVTTDAVKTTLAQYDQDINDYLTGKKDYGATKPVMYNDDNLMAMGVRNVAVNPDGTYVIQPREDLDLDAAEVAKKAEEYIKTSLKDTAFADSFYHPKTDRDALSKQKTSEVPVQPKAGVGEEVAQGKPTAEPQVTTEEGKNKINPETGVLEVGLANPPTVTIERDTAPTTEALTPEEQNRKVELETAIAKEDGKGTVTIGEALVPIEEAQAELDKLNAKTAPVSDVTIPTEETKDEKVARFRAEEQQELANAIPNIEDYKVDGKIDENLMPDDVKKTYQDIYKKYDNIISPLLEVKPAAGVRAVKPKVFDTTRKNALLAKFKNDSGKRALVSSIDRAATAIRQAYGDVPIYVHETTADMEAATAITGGATMARTGAGTFQYDADGKVIAVHVNLAKAGTDTAPHEFTHLILMDAFGDNPYLFKDFQERILKALSASRVAELEAFVNQYTNKEVRPEEFMAQLAGLMTANREKLTPTLAQKIMNLINEFVSRITKGKLIPFTANAQTKSLMDFFNTVSSAMSTGQGGENITAAAENVGKAFETDFRVSPFKLGAKDGSKEAIVGQVGVETAADEIAMQDLDVAKDMEAANRAAQDIKAATGWEVGADGQWRYEYPDVELNEDIEDDFDIMFYLQENARREGVRVRPNEMYPPAPLNKILDFGKLEQAYPYIDDLAFAVNPNLGGATAVFRPDRNLIEFGPDAIKNEGVEGFNRTLIHEVQHYIQDREGFEFGTNVSYEADKISKSQDVYKIPGLQLNGAANVGEAVKNGTNEILNMMDNGITVTDIIEGNYDKTKYSGNPEAIVKHTANEGDAESLDEMAATDLEGAKKLVEAAITKNAIADVAFEQYRATAGEVEARNAEERSRIPYAERLYGKTLESTEDVARRNQVLETAKKAVSAMDVIAKKRGVSKAAEIKMQREILGENYDKAKQISDNFEDIAEKLGITKICGL